MNLPRASWLRPRWLLSRRAAKALLWAVVLVAAAVGANVVGIYLVGSVANWELWLTATAGYFLVWRPCLYRANAHGWGWVRLRVPVRWGPHRAGREARRAQLVTRDHARPPLFGTEGNTV